MMTPKHLANRDAYRQFYIHETQVTRRPIHDFFRRVRGTCGILPKSFRALLQHPRYQTVEREVARRGFRHILDVGCSTGRVATLLGHRLGVAVSGVDLSPIQVAKARAMCWVKSVRFHEIFAEDLSHFAPPGTFDCVLLLEVLEHVINVDEILTAVTPLLAPGGLVLITLPNDDEVDDPSHAHVREFDEAEIHRAFGGFPEFHYEAIPAVAGVYAGGHFVRFALPTAGARTGSPDNSKGTNRDNTRLTLPA